MRTSTLLIKVHSDCHAQSKICGQSPGFVGGYIYSWNLSRVVYFLSSVKHLTSEIFPQLESLGSSVDHGLDTAVLQRQALEHWPFQLFDSLPSLGQEWDYNNQRNRTFLAASFLCKNVCNLAPQLAHSIGRKGSRRKRTLNPQCLQRINKEALSCISLWWWENCSTKLNCTLRKIPAFFFKCSSEGAYS